MLMNNLMKTGSPEGAENACTPHAVVGRHWRLVAKPELRGKTPTTVPHSAGTLAPASGFSRSVSEFLPHVEVSRATNETEKANIYRLRYSTYLKEGTLLPGAPEIFKDKYDESPNGMTFGLYVHGRLGSSIRLHVGTQQCSILPALSVFPDYVEPLLARGLTIIDSTRFVVEANASRMYPPLPYATMRLCAIAGEHFDADISLAAVRLEHQSFYKRLFGYQVVCEARSYPTLAKPISLMAVEFRKVRDIVKQRYPFLISTASERRAMFERG
jgi:hypothetical protein